MSVQHDLAAADADAAPHAPSRDFARLYLLDTRPGRAPDDRVRTLCGNTDSGRFWDGGVSSDRSDGSVASSVAPPRQLQHQQHQQYQHQQEGGAAPIDTGQSLDDDADLDILPHAHLDDTIAADFLSFNFDHLDTHRPGWTLESSSSSSSAGSSVSQLALVPCAHSEYHAPEGASALARFDFSHHGILVAETLDQAGPVSEFRRREQQDLLPLVERTTALQINGRDYAFVYLPHAQSLQHLDALTRHMRQKRNSFEPAGYLATVGAADAVHFSGYTVDKAFLSLNDGVTHTGLAKKTGTPVDIIRLVRRTTNRAEFQTLHMLRHLRQYSHQPPSVVHLRDLLNDYSAREITAVLEPSLTRTLDEVIESGSLTQHASLQTLGQCCDAVAWLHSHGIIHRSLNPTTIGLQSLDPVAAYLFDLGHATIGKRSRGCNVPVTSYLAPEMLDLCLDSGRPQNTYGRAVDVWALGMTALAMLASRLWDEPDLNQTHDTYYPELQDMVAAVWHAPTDALDLVSSMIEYDPQDRPSARAASLRMRKLLRSQLGCTPEVASRQPQRPGFDNSQQIDLVSVMSMASL